MRDDMNNKLGREFEEWLDSIEHTLPPIPKENAMSRNETLCQILKRLATLEEARKANYPDIIDCDMIDEEIKALRVKYQQVMNGPLTIEEKP